VLALGEIDLVNRIRKTAFLEHDRGASAVAGAESVEVDHGGAPIGLSGCSGKRRTVSGGQPGIMAKNFATGAALFLCFARPGVDSYQHAQNPLIAH
jgi:hypothetical protein